MGGAAVSTSTTWTRYFCQITAGASCWQVWNCAGVTERGALIYATKILRAHGADEIAVWQRTALPQTCVATRRAGEPWRRYERRAKFIATKTIEEAEEVAPRAAWFEPVVGGFMAFESVQDHKIWEAQQ